MKIAIVETMTGRPVIAVHINLERAVAGVLELLAGAPRPRTQSLRPPRKKVALRRPPAAADPPAAGPVERGSTPPSGPPDVITLGPGEFRVIR